MTDRLIDAEELAAFLSVPVSWVRAETRAERIPHLKLGRYRRYQPADVLAWLDEQRGGRRRRNASNPAERPPARIVDAQSFTASRDRFGDASNPEVNGGEG